MNQAHSGIPLPARQEPSRIAQSMAGLALRPDQPIECAKPASQLDTAMNAVGMEILALESAADKLFARLAPVLQAASVEGEKGLGPVIPIRAPLLAELGGYEGRLRNLCQTLDSLHARLVV